MKYQKNNMSAYSRKAFLETLESRELLAGDLPFGTNLIDNGDFEEVSGVVANDWEGNPGPIETSEFANRPERGRFAFLKSGQIATQTVNVQAGQAYILAFEFRHSSRFSNGGLTVNNNAGAWSTTDRFQTGSIFLKPEESTLQIEFLAENDVLIDCVRLFAVERIRIDNFDFENTPNDESEYFNSTDLTGWNSIGDKNLNHINIKNSGGSDGGKFLNVNGRSEVVDAVFQKIATNPNRNYFVSFDLRSDTQSDSIDNQLRVRWNGEGHGVFQGHNQWHNVGFFAETDARSTRLVFREGKSADLDTDFQGPYIDNIRMFRIMPGAESLTVFDSDNSEREFVENEGPIGLISESLDIGNSVVDKLTGAIATIINPLDGQDETLAVDLGETGIQATFNTEKSRLILKGLASLDKYQSVLKTITYENNSEAPNETQREFRIRTKFKNITGLPLKVNVNVTGVNDPPRLLSIEDQTVTVLTEFKYSVIALDEESPNDLAYTVNAEGTALGLGDPLPTISDTGEIVWVPQQSGSVEITVTVQDPEGELKRRRFQVTALLDASIPEDFSPFSGARQLSNVVPTLRNDIYEADPDMNLNLDKEYRALMGTDDGQIEILLYDNQTPLTTNNFVNLARDGYYDGLTFFRVVSLLSGSETEGFIAQGGDPVGTGVGGPGYGFDDENLEGAIFDKPLIAMANRGKGTFSNGSQFFLTYDDKVTHLNGNHTVFGEITAGMDVVHKINKRTPGSGGEATIIRTIKILEN